MSYDEFTPTTEQVREGYAWDPESEYRDPIGYPPYARGLERAFDRWLAEVERKAAESARASAQKEIDKLKNRVWDLERRWHSFDPWERAESEAEDA